MHDKFAYDDQKINEKLPSEWSQKRKDFDYIKGYWIEDCMLCSKQGIRFFLVYYTEVISWEVIGI